MSETPQKPADPNAKPEWAMSRRERRAAERAAQGLPPKRRRRWPWLVLLLLVAGGAVWFKTGGEQMIARMTAPPEGEAAQTGAAADPAPAPETAEAAEAAVPVMQITRSELMTVVRGPLRETVKVTGSLNPLRQVQISAEVAGHVVEVGVEAGDAVAEGDVLVQIDRAPLETQLRQQRASADATRAQLKLAELQLDRTRSLVDRGLTPPSELEAGQASVDQLNASLAAQEAQIQTAERALEDTTITAPFAGVVAGRSVDPGSYVTATAPLLTLVDLSQLEFQATLPVGYAPRIRSGQPVELTVDGADGRTFAGRLARISPVAAEGTRMLPVFVVIPNEDMLLRGGMFASGFVVLAEKANGIGVPVQAVLEDSRGRYVLKREGDHVVRQAVEIARTWDGGRVMEIASGLAEGDVVVALPLPQLRPGMRIEQVD